MKNESDFRNAVRDAHDRSRRDNAVSLAVIALFFAVVFGVLTIATEIARSYLPVHNARPPWAKPAPIAVPAVPR